MMRQSPKPCDRVQDRANPTSSPVARLCAQLSVVSSQADSGYQEHGSRCLRTFVGSGMDIAHLSGYEATQCPASTATSFYCGGELPESDAAAAIAVP